MKYAAGVLLLAALVLVPAFRRGATLGHTHESPEALSVAVIDAWTRGDARALSDLALSEREFKTIVWPALPAARPERNLTADYVWNDLHAKSRTHLTAHARRPLPSGARLVSVGFSGPTTSYGTFEVLRDSHLVLTDGEGRQHRVRLFGSVIKYGGRYKVFSFVVD